MPNTLTGDYEAVLQVSLRQINGILATLHQRRIDPAASPSFAHSVSFRVGDRPLSFAQEASRYRSWVTDVTTKMRVTGSAAELRTLSHTGPPGLAAMFEEAWAGMDTARLEPVPAGSIRGVVQVQVSNPTISIPPGSAASVVVHAMIRCHYVPDSGSTPLPQPLHGEVRALYTVAPRTLPDGRRVLRVHISAQDADIQFIPAAGTITGADVNTVVAEVRRGIRAHFQPMDVELPADFAFAEFGGIGAGSSAAVCLPLHLSEGIPPAGALATVTNAFLGANEFAIAVSQAYVQARLDPLLNSIRAYADRYSVGVSFAGAGFATYRASVSQLSMAWRAGEIDVSGRIELTTDADLAPNGYITFTQTITLALDVPTQTVTIVRVGDPSVDESWWLPHSRAVNAVNEARDGALPAASTTINAAFAGARGRLNGGLTTFDPYTSAKYTGLDVTPDGIIVRGRVDTGTRLNPIVDIVETADGLAYTAFRSWVPGGFIDEFRWTWVEKTHPIPWFNKPKHIDDTHRFICVKPPGLKFADRICLHIEGTRVDHNGFVESVVGGDWCRVTAHEPILTVPPWWMKVMVPIWVPDPPADFVLDELIAGHINMAGDARGDQVRPNTIVHFTGPRMDRPLTQMSRALELAALREASLLIVLVLPPNTFAMRNREMESRLGEMTERFAAHLLVTEDYAGGWTKLFAAPEHSSTHLVDGRGRHTWSSQEHDLDPQALARALERHIVPAPQPRPRLLRLAVQAGAPALDTVFRDDQGREYSMRRLRGRPVRLAFWQSWSSPCLRELRRLQHLQEQGESTMVLAVNGGEDRAVIEQVRQHERFTFPLIHDPDQVIAALYGVTCWPTTVSVNRQGVVENVQFGITHEHARRADRAGA
jgi:peroxiredoxin